MATDETERSASENLRLNTQADWTSASIADLISHITTIHHARSRRLLRQAACLVRKMIEFRDNPGLPTLVSAFRGFERDMLAHLENEELVLFPACLALDRASHPGATPKGVIDVSQAIREMSTGHESVHQDIERLLGLAQGESGHDAHLAIAAFRLSLIDLAADLVEHGRLEEEILLPAAMFQQELSQTRQTSSILLSPPGADLSDPPRIGQRS